MTGPTFDQERSDAIRTMLIDTVEQTPARDHRRHVRIVVLAILAALGIGVGSSAVAVAMSGVDLFGPPAATQAAAVPTASATTTPLPTPTPAPTKEPHPLVVTGDTISPRDVLSAPPDTPAWSIDVPGAGDPCQLVRTIDVSDGYALVQSGPTSFPEDLGSNGCEPTETRLWVSLVDTRDGVTVWTRDWTWPFDQVTYPWSRVALLGTSGTVLVRTTLQGIPAAEPYPYTVPNEVLDLATGSTLGEVEFSNGVDGDPLIFPVADASGDVIVNRRTSQGVEVLREDPLEPSSPRWSIELPEPTADVRPVPTDSSVLAINYRAGDASFVKVVDIDSGGVMVEGPSDRSYSYLDGVTLRVTSTSTGAGPTGLAGVDDAGNEIWSRADPGGLTVLIIGVPGANPRGEDYAVGTSGSGLVTATDVLVVYSDGHRELIDALTGESRWEAAGPSCPADYRPSMIRYPDGALVPDVSWYPEGGGRTVQGPTCGYASDGELIDPSGRPLRQDFWTAPVGSSAVYTFEGGWASGGLFTYKYHSPEGTIPTATVRDSITGDVLWTRTISPDERWTFAGGYLVGISGGTVYGLG